MASGATRRIAEWSSSLSFDDIPPSAVDKTKLQIMSVLGATAAGARSSKIGAYSAAVQRWSGGGAGPCEFYPGGEPGSLSDAILVNAAASVVHDFDDYLFAGHTGHSAILVPLAIAQMLAAEGSPVSGEEFITAAVAANEAGGRLGASMLFGPHNGQMWSYIHLVGGAVAGAVMLGLDAAETESAIGMAFSQPNYPLIASFMGSDAKALIAAQPCVDGAHGALLAAAGLRGAGAILEDRGGFWAKFQPDAMAKIISGFGEAWVTESLSYKIYPGCAYIDTAMDALFAILGRFEADEGRAMKADEIESIDVEAGFLTTGMETMSGWYRGEHISPMNVNFSVALSGSASIVAGELTPAQFEPAFYLDREDEILALAKKWRIENSTELTMEMSGKGFDLREILKKQDEALAGADFTKYEARFPAVVKLTTTGGETLEERRDIPLGGAGRPADETRQLAEKKYRDGVGASADAVATLDQATDAAAALRV